MLNKCELENRIAKETLYKGLDMERIQKLVGKIYIKETSAYTKEGLEECFDWMSKNVYIPH
jgi:site-specific recombinase XerD